MKNNAIIFDLDDTLISTHMRQYRCIEAYLRLTGIPFIDYITYYEMRRSNMYSNSQLLESLGIKPDFKKFRSFYRMHIESEKFLSYDTLIVKKELLLRVREKNLELCLLSLRSNPENAERQLKKLDIYDLFTETCFEAHDPAVNPKIERLKELRESYDILAFCGDTIADYEAAEYLNINFVQVKTSLYDLDDFEHAHQFNTINQYILSLL